MSQGGPLDDIHRKVSLRSCMSDDLRETLGFNTFRKERGTEEAALPWLPLYLAHRGRNQSGARKDNRLLFREQ